MTDELRERRADEVVDYLLSTVDESELPEAPPGVQVYAVGLCSASACAPSMMDPMVVVREVNAQHPTGVGPWVISTDEKFSGGEPNPCPCSSDPNRTHWLLNC